MPRSALPSFVLGSAIVAAAAILSRAGPLTPPGGTVASTYKTLSEVEPRTAISAATTPGDAFAASISTETMRAAGVVLA